MDFSLLISFLFVVAYVGGEDTIAIETEASEVTSSLRNGNGELDNSSWDQRNTSVLLKMLGNNLKHNTSWASMQTAMTTTVEMLAKEVENNEDDNLKAIFGSFKETFEFDEKLEKKIQRLVKATELQRVHMDVLMEKFSRFLLEAGDIVENGPNWDQVSVRLSKSVADVKKDLEPAVDEAIRDLRGIFCENDTCPICNSPAGTCSHEPKVMGDDTL